MLFGREESKSGQVTKLRIVLHKTEKLPWAWFAQRDKEFVYETKDPKILALAERFLSTPFRSVANSVVTDIRPGDYYLGKVEVTCTKQRFFIGISTNGFSLNSDICVPRNTLYSWGLAKLIDDALVRDTKKPLPKAMMERLSGQALIEAQKFEYERAYPNTKNANSGEPQSPPSADHLR